MTTKNGPFSRNELLSELYRFVDEYGLPIDKKTYKNYCVYGYPGYTHYLKEFKSWRNVLISAKLPIPKSCETKEKGKKAERIINNTFSMKEHSSIINWQSPYDFICSKGYTIDVKGSKLIQQYHGKIKLWKKPVEIWSFNTKRKTDVDYFICLGFDTEYNKLLHIWIFKNSNKIKNKSAIIINKKWMDEYLKYEYDIKKCNLDMTLQNYEY